MTAPAAGWSEDPPMYYAAISRFSPIGAYGGPTAYLKADSYEHAERLIAKESDLRGGPITNEVDG